MTLIYYLPDKKAIEGAEGETLLQAARRANIPHASICGGNARCSTCRISVMEGLDHCSPRTPGEQRIADLLHLPPVVRLACQTIPEGNVKVRRLVEDLEDVDLDTLYVEGAGVCAIGEEKRVLILFADIQGFTAFAESLLPYDVIYTLNLHLRHMGEIVNVHGGRMDNYMGDGFIALFEVNAPEQSRAAKKAGIDVNCYQGTKHSMGSQLINQGVPLDILAAWFGHKDVRTTKRYAKVKLTGRRNIWEDVSPMCPPDPGENGEDS